MDQFLCSYEKKENVMERLMKSLLLSVLVVGLLASPASALLVTNQTTGQTLFYDGFERAKYGDWNVGLEKSLPWPGTWDQFGSNSGGNGVRMYPHESESYTGYGAVGFDRNNGGADIKQFFAMPTAAQTTAGDVIRVDFAMKSNTATPGDEGVGFKLQTAAGRHSLFE